METPSLKNQNKKECSFFWTLKFCFSFSVDFDYPELDDNLQIIKKVQPTVSSTNFDSSVNPSPVSVSVANVIDNGSSQQLTQVATPKIDRSLKPTSTINSNNPHMLNNAVLPPEGKGSLSSSASSKLSSDSQNSSIKAITNSFPNNIYEKNPDLSGYSKNINLYNDISKISKASNLDIDLTESVLERDKKENELREFQQMKDKTLKDDDLRVKDAEKRLKDLEDMRKKEQKDVADLMRMKRKLLEDIETEKAKQESDRQKLADEEIRRYI